MVRSGSRTFRKWSCQCDCGRRVDAFYTDLRSGKSTSCGCKQRAGTPVPAERVGSVVVLRALGSEVIHGKQRLVFLCRCDCGVETKRLGQDLRTARKTGHNISCGCGVGHQVPKGADSQAWRGYGGLTGSCWRRIVSGAARRAIPIEMTIEEAWQLFERQAGRCALTGQPLSMRVGRRYGTASLDRIDSLKGYVAGNVQWVHKDANLAKRSLTNVEFIAICRAVAAYHPPQLENHP